MSMLYWLALNDLYLPLECKLPESRNFILSNCQIPSTKNSIELWQVLNKYICNEWMNYSINSKTLITVPENQKVGGSLLVSPNLLKAITCFLQFQYESVPIHLLDWRIKEDVKINAYCQDGNTSSTRRGNQRSCAWDYRTQGWERGLSPNYLVFILHTD